MARSIAIRTLEFREKRTGQSGQIHVSITEPCAVSQKEVSFPVNEGAAQCDVVIEGLRERISERTYGVDSIQALHMAANIDPLLRRLSNEYDLYFTDGEPYFDSEDDIEQGTT